jgi:hypothetical protein
VIKLPRFLILDLAFNSTICVARRLIKSICVPDFRVRLFERQNGQATTRRGRPEDTYSLYPIGLNQTPWNYGVPLIAILAFAMSAIISRSERSDLGTKHVLRPTLPLNRSIYPHHRVATVQSCIKQYGNLALIAKSLGFMLVVQQSFQLGLLSRALSEA